MTKDATPPSSLGNLLRAQREERGLTLEQAEEATRIRRRYLEALEAEHFAELPGEVYVRGFLRLYAEYLGLNPDEVLSRYRPLSRPTRADLVSPPRLDHARGSIGGRLLALTLLALIALGGIYLYQQQVGPEAVPTPTPVPVVAAQPTPVPTATATVTPQPEPTVTPTITPTPLPSTVTVRIDISGPTRVDAVVDGNPVLSQTLQRGDRHSWTGESIKITAANAGNVILTVNGQHVGVFGANNERKEFEWISPARAAAASGGPAAPPPPGR